MENEKTFCFPGLLQRTETPQPLNNQTGRYAMLAPQSAYRLLRSHGLHGSNCMKSHYSRFTRLIMRVEARMPSFWPAPLQLKFVLSTYTRSNSLYLTNLKSYLTF